MVGSAPRLRLSVGTAAMPLDHGKSSEFFPRYSGAAQLYCVTKNSRAPFPSVVPAERLKRVHARLRRAMARRAGTHTPQPLVSYVAMGPGSALASLAWPGRQTMFLTP